jgi:hypothetical protein
MIKMKKIFGYILSLIVGLTIVSCEDYTFDQEYDAPIDITFVGVDNNNIVTVPGGTMSYTAEIEVIATGTGIKYFEIYTADSRTGAKVALIESTTKVFDDGEGNGVPSYSTEYVVDNLVENKGIKVIVTDEEGNVFERNLLVEITPVVHFSESLKMETVENYYGPYFASWLNGRVYMRRDGEQYKNEIDFSLGNVVIESEGASAVPALVNPAQRGVFNLLTMSGLQEAKFEMTTLTIAEYNAINEVNASPVTSLTDPTKDAVKLEKDKIYLFKTANGKKGLIHISSLDAKSGTIESVTGEWVSDTPYHQVTLSVKVVSD